MTTISSPRDLPAVARLAALCAGEGIAPEIVTDAARRAIAAARTGLLGGTPTSEADLVGDVLALAGRDRTPRPRTVINATGVVLHTNLGRAVLSGEARAAMAAAAAYSDLELDLESGGRGKRDTRAAELLVRLTGAEAAMVANNCAASLFLALSALAKGRDVVVSRGQSVEIGGRFRIPDVCAESGAVLREVGTTNRTYREDYERAVGENTALLLRVHRSNFHLTGFVADVDAGELVGIGAERGLPVVDDLGSGCLVDTEVFGLRHEPTVQESVRSGAGLTLFSGDKLLGGPQAGLIVGRRDLVERLRRHPLARALRCDKVTLAALHATLLQYVRGEHMERVPTLRMLGLSREEVRARARSWADALALPGAEVLDSAGQVGGGSLPDAPLASAALVLEPGALGAAPDALAAALRTGDTPVMARVERDRIWLDPRTVQPDEDEMLLEALHAAVARAGAPAEPALR